jgi:hypothetical protein
MELIKSISQSITEMIAASIVLISFIGSCINSHRIKQLEEKLNNGK